MQFFYQASVKRLQTIQHFVKLKFTCSAEIWQNVSKQEKKQYQQRKIGMFKHHQVNQGRPGTEIYRQYDLNYLISFIFRYVYCRHCDLSSQKSIREFVKEFKKKEKRVDGLINNAGIYHAPRSISEDGVEIHFAVNHLGHFLLTNLLTDMIKSSGPGNRIVFLMNLDYRKGQVVLDDLNFDRRVYNKSEAFYQSQLANMMLVKELAERFKSKPNISQLSRSPFIG